MKQFQLNEDFVPCSVLLTIYVAARDNAIIFHFFTDIKKIYICEINTLTP